jgi:hypothetical protein
LPAYSPELNPVERLWEDLKNRIDVADAQEPRRLAGTCGGPGATLHRRAIALLTGYAYLVETICTL